MAKLTPAITKELQETVRKNPHIKAVYFDEKGNHYFNKHNVDVHTDDGNGNSKGVKKVDALPGVKQSVLKVTGPDKVTKGKKVNTEYNAIAHEMDRDEILEMEIEEVDDNKAINDLKKENEKLQAELKKSKEKGGKEKY